VIQRAALFRLADAGILHCRRSSRAILYAGMLSILSLAGCVQDSPLPSKERMVSLLVELLHDEAPEVRQTAAESLGKIGDSRSMDSILPLTQDPAATVREASLLAMARLKPTANEGVVVLLAQALEDPVESVQQAAIVAIGEIQPESRLLAPVVGILRSSVITNRRAAAQALLQIDSNLWISALVAAGHDSDAEVRQGVVAAVGEWGGVAASPWLRERLAEDSSPGVRAEAAYRLGVFSDPDARAALNKAMAKDPDIGVRRWAKQKT
jgi:HEAT repeat protein